MLHAMKDQRASSCTKLGVESRRTQLWPMYDRDNVWSFLFVGLSFPRTVTVRCNVCNIESVLSMRIFIKYPRNNLLIPGVSIVIRSDALEGSSTGVKKNGDGIRSNF